MTDTPAPLSKGESGVKDIHKSSTDNRTVTSLWRHRLPATHKAHHQPGDSGPRHRAEWYDVNPRFMYEEEYDRHADRSYRHDNQYYRSYGTSPPHLNYPR